MSSSKVNPARLAASDADGSEILGMAQPIFLDQDTLRRTDQSIHPGCPLACTSLAQAAGGLERVVELLAGGMAHRGHPVAAVILLDPAGEAPPIVDALIEACRA